jgi:hypothetical protein
LWIVEDNVPSDIWVAEGRAARARSVTLFASLTDPEAEGTGIYFGTDPHTLFVNVQHEQDCEAGHRFGRRQSRHRAGIAGPPDAPGRRPTRTLPAMRIRSRRSTASAILLAGIATALLGACGGDDESAEDVPADDESAPAAPEDGEPVEDWPSCDALAGLPTAEVVEVFYCADGEVVKWHLTGPGTTCRDGRTLYMSERGWGYRDGTWQATNSPPIMECVTGLSPR